MSIASDSTDIVNSEGVGLAESAIESWENTTPTGDANRDGVFNADDLQAVLQALRYETSQVASWAEGDWSDDGVLDSQDLVDALAQGQYTDSTVAARVATSQPNDDGVAIARGGLSDWAAAVDGLFDDPKKQALGI